MSGTNLSALAVLPNGAQWSIIQKMRIANDRQVHIWPPHINIFYPFVPESQFKEAATRLSRELGALGPLRMRFCGLGNFGGTVYLKPACAEDPGLAKLHAACKAAFPDILEKHASFAPHLTIGQFEGRSAAEAFMVENEGISIETEVSCLAFLARDTMKSPFRSPFQVALGGGFSREGTIIGGDAKPYTCATPWPWTFQCPMLSDEGVGVDFLCGKAPEEIAAAEGKAEICWDRQYVTSLATATPTIFCPATDDSIVDAAMTEVPIIGAPTKAQVDALTTDAVATSAPTTALVD
jgi:2'-5' RNA ligase